MLLSGEDGSNYDAGELGWFKSTLSKVKKVGVGTAKVATLPVRKVTIPTIKWAAKTALKPFSAGQPVEEVAPSCGLFQRISRMFGGSPNCS